MPNVMVALPNIEQRGGFTLGVQAFEAWLYTFVTQKSLIDT